ncbi:MAG: helix-turn-helix transcriptional regulator [Bdellovibrionales bacterium]|nr:helix-turn-helix transcriptional regulator [Bdellovibrionales bacterium]
MSTATKFGRMMREHREEKAISQEKLARELNLSRISINNYEQGKQVPNLDTAIRIALYLGISLSKLAQAVDESSLGRALNNLENTELSNDLRDVLKDLRRENEHKKS